MPSRGAGASAAAGHRAPTPSGAGRGRLPTRPPSRAPSAAPSSSKGAGWPGGGAPRGDLSPPRPSTAGRASAAFFQRDFKGPEKGKGASRWRHDRWEGPEGRPWDQGGRTKGKGGEKGKGGKAKGKRKYDATESEQNHPYAHLAFRTTAVHWVVGVLLTHRAVWLLDRGVERAADVVDSAAGATVAVIDAVSDGAVAVTGHAVDGIVTWGSVLAVLVVAQCLWQWHLKVRLRLAGFEPEANVFTAQQVWEVTRSARKVGALLDKVELDHKTPEGRVVLHVQGSEATPYVVELDSVKFLQGSPPGDVVLKCTCLDHLSRGPMCKHAGAACLYLRSHLAELQQLGLSGPPLAGETLAVADQRSAAIRRAESLRVVSRGPLQCFEGLAQLRQKALQLRDRVEPMVEAVRPRSTGRSVCTQTEEDPAATFLDAVGLQRYAEALLVGDQESITSVDVVAYSFDVVGLTEALAHLGPKVRILMDEGQCFGRTRRQLQAAQQMSSPSG